MSDYTTMISVAATISALGGAWLTIRKIARDAHKSKKEHAEEILSAAKELDLELKLKTDAKIQALDSQLKNLEANVKKDLEHLKETHTNEIKNLGEKIEALRDQLNSQHAQMIAFLSKLVDKK